MAERSIAAVLKTVEGNTSGGSNPPFSAGNMKDFDNTLKIFHLTREKKRDFEQKSRFFLFIIHNLFTMKKRNFDKIEN